MAKLEKIALVEEIKKNFKESQSLVLADYRGLNVHEIAELRKKLRESDVQYKIYKNTLTRIITKELGLKDLDPYLVGPTGIAFIKKEAIQVVKMLSEFSKKHECFKAKAGLIDGEVLDDSKLKVLASLPSQEELIAKLLGTLKSPLASTVNILVSPIRGLVCVLNSVTQKG